MKYVYIKIFKKILKLLEINGTFILEYNYSSPLYLVGESFMSNILSLCITEETFHKKILNLPWNKVENKTSLSASN